MTNKQTPKALVIAARPGAVCKRVIHDRGTFYRVMHDGMVIGQSATPANAWRVASRTIRTLRQAAEVARNTPAPRPTVHPVRELLTVALLPGLVMALVFSLLANAGLVTSDPAGKHPIDAAQMWGLR
jgi:hypothetical protein